VIGIDEGQFFPDVVDFCEQVRPRRGQCYDFGDYCAKIWRFLLEILKVLLNKQSLLSFLKNRQKYSTYHNNDLKMNQSNIGRKLCSLPEAI
jgi:hypothetical protein